MNRKEELLALLKQDENSGTKAILDQLIDEILFLEDQLTKLKKLPFLKVHPSNPNLQKATPASRQYKELLQQYTNCIKVLISSCGKDSEDANSILRKWAKSRC